MGQAALWIAAWLSAWLWGSAQDAARSARVVAPARTTCGAGFGQRFDVQGDVAVLGRAGLRAWIFERGAAGWSETARLGDSERGEGPPGDTFADGVAVADGWIAVTEPGATVEGVKRAGAVHLFRRADAGWLAAQRLTLANPGEGLRFGSVIAMDGGVLAARAAGERPFGAEGSAAAVHVFELEAGVWVPTARLVREPTGDAFGAALAVNAGRVLVGVPADGDFRGAASLFERGRGDWSSCTMLGGAWRTEGDFGRSVALDGPWAAVGSWGGVPDNAEHGVVLFREGPEGWAEVQRLEARDEGGTLRGPREPWFGSGLALAGGHLVVGARWSEQEGRRTGAAFHYRLDAGSGRWVSAQPFQLRVGAEFQAIGGWVALNGSRAWIGAPESDLHHDSPRCNSGAVIEWELAP